MCTVTTVTYTEYRLIFAHFLNTFFCTFAIDYTLQKHLTCI